MRFSWFLVSVLAGFAFIADNVSAYVSPGQPTGYVNDYTGTLSTETKTGLEEMLKRFQLSGKGEVAVAIISKLNGDVIEDYSIALAREWGIGVKGKDNGVLLLVAKDDHELRIEVGYGFEGVLTDAKSSRIIRDIITPRFKEGNYDAGVVNGVKEILGVVEPTFEGGAQTIDYTTEPAVVSKSSSIPLEPLFILGFIFIQWMAAILGRSKSWWLGGVLGAFAGGVISTIFTLGITPVIILVFLGLIFDAIVSRGYTHSIANGTRPPWWTGGGSSGGRSSGFGGFGGGSFGGGGSSGKW